MASKFSTWWQRIRKFLVVIVVIVLLIGVFVLFILIGYRLTWTGFSNKTLWDWLQLFIIPVVLVIGGYLLNLASKRTEQETTADNQREAVLQDYIDQMSELLLKEHLRESVAEKKPPYEIRLKPNSEDEVRTIARVRTLTVLSRLDGVRKKSVLLFLYESDLIDKHKPIVDLRGADLRKADLYGVNLSRANLREANLWEADLHRASLREADLRAINHRGADLRETVGFDARLLRSLLADLDAKWHRVNLREANLDGANLCGANLRGANLREAHLWGADLDKAFLIRADLYRAKLNGANLHRAFLNEANLHRADLTGANLREAMLHGANLREAHLWEADLRGAFDIDPEELEEQTGSLGGAIMPDGSKHP